MLALIVFTAIYLALLEKGGISLLIGLVAFGFIGWLVFNYIWLAYAVAVVVLMLFALTTIRFPVNSDKPTKDTK